MTNTNAPDVPFDLTDPIWAIEHIAQCFRLSVDRAREYTSRENFPAARRLGDSSGRLLWPREEILAWFLSLSQLPAAARRRNTAPPEPKTITSAPARPGAHKPLYQPRARRTARNGGAA